MTFDLINIQRKPYCIFDPSLAPIGFQLFKGDSYNKTNIFNLTWRFEVINLSPSVAMVEAVNRTEITFCRRFMSAEALLMTALLLTLVIYL